MTAPPRGASDTMSAEHTTSPARELIHSRQVHCRAYRRDDGLWDIEGEMIDTKTHDIHTYGNKDVKAGEPVHHMRLILSLDEKLVIRAVRTESLHFPGGDCHQIQPAYQKLVGVSIGPGFTRVVKDLFRGVGGCTHLSELTGPMATTAYQAMWDFIEARHPEGSSGIVNTCFSFRSGGESVRIHWPEKYTGQG
ncbi:MAG: DUF2889 domain-containing protein [Proteobacteria bacterium]|nr:DUF2889 domain-containing protein [Pseudomonadota bacterium]HQR04131.1 DUF2889 domain-containing protein [Rhodocyclaceae bacterium]